MDSILHECSLLITVKHDHAVTCIKGLIFLPMQSVPITTKLVSSNPSRGEMCSIQHYVIKLVSDFLLVLQFPPPIKLTATI